MSAPPRSELIAEAHKLAAALVGLVEDIAERPVETFGEGKRVEHARWSAIDMLAAVMALRE